MNLSHPGRTDGPLHSHFLPVPAGTVCAIMGPSGAGKSSILNVLAGRSASAAGIEITGTITVAGQRINPLEFRERIAYVMQDDSLLATATPREALEFSAQLRLPGTMSRDEIRTLIDGLIEDLGLESCADTMIGGALIKGISGGQRKRTSVGIELITDPALIFLDEPTSGLDSFSAYNMVALLRTVAAANAVCLCTIHQPSSEVFDLFDQVIFMKDGKVFYHGAVRELTAYFRGYGYGHNTATCCCVFWKPFLRRPPHSPLLAPPRHGSQLRVPSEL